MRQVLVPYISCAAIGCLNDQLSGSFSMRQVLVHILCCYWLPERPIEILVLIREFLHETKYKYISCSAIGCLKTNRNSRSYQGASPSGKYISCAAIGCLKDQ